MTMIYSEGFESGSAGFTTSTPEFSDGAGDFFTVTVGTTIGSFYEVTGYSGTSFFAAMDLDGEGAASTQTLTIEGIDISGYENLTFSGLFAEDDDGSNEDWDANTTVVFEYRIDGGAWTTLVAFASQGETNTAPGQDTDFDGVADGPTLTSAFALYTAGIMGTGSVLDLRVTYNVLDSGDEDFAMDDLTIEGDAVATGGFDLQITEIWPGNAEGDNLTGDWFEVTNLGDVAWTAVDGALYFDDDSADATTADALNGVTEIAAGESVVFVDADTAANFIAVWGGLIELGQVGTYDGSGLGGGGDAVTLFLDAGDDGVTADDIIDSEAYPDADAAAGGSYDVVNGEFSDADGTSGQGTDVVATAVNDAGEAATGSPTNGAAITVESAFTLELFHIADQEASTSAITNAPNLSAIYNALEAEDLGDDGVADNSLFLSSGDAFIPGVFFSAGAAVFGSEGIADIQIQNELGIQAIALGNHEFDYGTELLASLIDGTATGDFSALTTSDLAGLDFEGTDMSYLSTNLDYSTDANMASLEVAGGGETTGNTVSSSVVFDVNGEQIGVVGATTPTLGSISSPGDIGISPDWAGTNPTDAELDALAAEIQAEVDALLADNPTMNKVILLAHMQQIEIEEALATRLENVDIIVAGGSNTRLFDEDDVVRDGDTVQGEYPNFITNAGGTQTVVVNTDGSYKYLGRLVIDFDADGNVIADSYDATVSGAYATTDEMVADLGAEGLIDPEIQAIVDAIEAQIIETESNVFGYSDVFLNGERSGTFAADDTDGVRTQETNLGNLTADANLAAAKDIDETVVLSIKNGGGIRASIGESIVPAGGTEAERTANAELVDGDGNVIKAEGGISQNDIQTTLAFNNGLTLLTLTKAELITVLEHGVSSIDSANNGGVAGSFAQVSGVSFSYDDSLAAGSRIIDAAIVDEDGTVIAELMRDGVIVGDDTETFRIVTLSFMAEGGDGYPFPTGEGVERLDLFDLDGNGEDDGVIDGVATFAENGTEQDALAEYLAENHGTQDTAYDDADQGVDSDDRIQSVSYQDSTVYGDADTGPAVFSYEQTFDGETTNGGIYTDTGDAASDHDLVNNDGAAPVDSVVSGIDVDGSLGFDASYVNTRDDVGLTDGDYVGVANYTGTVGAFTSGAQGYQMSDADGQMVLAFETVDTSGAGAVNVSLDVFVQDGGYEAGDTIQIGVDTDGDGEIDVVLMDLEGDDIDAFDGIGAWTTLTTTLDAEVEQAALLVKLDSNSGSEAVYIDSVKIETAPQGDFTYAQDFEDEAANAVKYADSGDASVDHDLQNAADADRRIVDSVASGLGTNGQLSFDASWEATRLDQGITEGMTDFTGTGVTDNTSVPGVFLNGDNGYLFKNTDGQVTLAFEEIDSSASDLVTVSVDAFISDAHWEKSSDLIRFGLDTDGDGEIDVSMVDSTDRRVHNIVDMGQWVTYTVDVVAPESVQFIVEFDSNLQNESMMIDNLVITGQSGVAGIAADPAPEAQASLSYSVASVTEVAGGAEIVSFVPGLNVAVIANGAGLSFYNVSDITNPVLIGAEDPMDFGATSSEVTSVDTRVTDAGYELVAAVPNATVTDNGVIIFADGETDHLIEVGALPDMVTFDESGDYILVANEGQSADGDNAPGVLPNPDGSISIIQIERDIDRNATGTFVTNTYDFSDASITLEALEAKGVRINSDAPSVAADIEPEFITLSGNTAYISLQENNAIAIIEDITTFTGFTIDNIVSAGTVDHLTIGNGIDPSDDDGAVNIATQDVVGMAMPDGIVAFEVGGMTYFAGASEGDTRGVDEMRAADAYAAGLIDTSVYSAEDMADENLGRLTISTIDGDTDGDGLIDQLTSFGTRSVAIYDAEGNVVFDSGDLLARIALEELGEDYPDSRSDAKGVEPEYVEFGEIDGKPYLFVGLERAQSVVVFDISDPENPVYDQFINLPDVSEPEGLKFISAEDSPNGTPLLVVAGEDNDSLAIIELNRELNTVTIGEVQGAGDESEMVGQEVTVRGVVVGNYSAEGELSGFYLQSTDADADGDAATSDGVFVYLGDATGELVDVTEGDLVTLTGLVDEYFGQTQIDTLSALTVEANGQLDLVTAATMDIGDAGSYAASGTYEQFEGMLVTIPQTLVVSEYYQYSRFGQITLTEEERPYQYTQQNTPDVAGYEAYLEEVAADQIILDDGNNIDNAYTGDDAVLPYGDDGLSVDNYFSGGDSITDLTGVLTWGWAGSSGTDAWRLRPTEEAEIVFEDTNVEEATPDAVGGSLTVASFNVLNYFTTIDDGSSSVNGDPRGAHSEAELEAQTAKLVSAIITMDADVLGLVEIENEFGDQNGDGRFAVQYLVDAINAELGAEVYAYVDPGVGTVDSTDVITGAFIYNATTVEVTAGSSVAILNDTTNPLSFDNAVFDGSSTNRAALAVSFTELATGESFTAAVNHFKSKGSVNSAPGNEDAGDGAGANNAIRLQAAESLDAWLESDPTGSGDTRTLILGDLNAYAEEDPITYLESEGYTDLAVAFEGDDAYSYVFDSQLGTLDYALANDDMFDFVTGATEWHINSDSLVEFDYNDDILDSGEQSYEEKAGGNDLFNEDPFRTSDHDPIIIGLDLDQTVEIL